MNKWEKVYRKNKDIVSREIDNEMILMPIYKTDKEINEMYTLNETAAKMWELIDGKLTLAGIKDMLCKHYKKVPRETIEKDLEEFIKDMKEIKAVQ